MNIVDIEKLPVRRTKSLSTEKLQETEAEGRRPGIVWSRSNEEQTLDIEELRWLSLTCHVSLVVQTSNLLEHSIDSIKDDQEKRVKKIINF